MPDLSEDEDRELTNRKSSWAKSHAAREGMKGSLEWDPFWDVEIKFDVWMMVLVIFSDFPGKMVV